MKKYLASFCNCGSAKLAVFTNTGIETEIEVDCSFLKTHVGGITGIAFYKNFCVIGLQTNPSVVLFLDQNFSVAQIHSIEDVKDMHGIAVLGEELLLVSTGTSQILAFNPASGAVRPVWFDQPSLSDTTHLNDIAARGATVYVSKFGVRAPGAMRDGAIFDAVTGVQAVHGLREPHSVTTFGSDLYILESPAGDLLQVRDGFAPKRIFGIAGYARGLVVNEAHYLVGKSGYRVDSRHQIGDSRAAPLSPGDAAAEGQRKCGVFIVDRANSAAGFVDMSEIGNEIYALAEIPESFQALTQPVADPQPSSRSRRERQPAATPQSDLRSRLIDRFFPKK